ncbi:hypothetical protein LJB92_04545 [Bacteroidales bacterium OttesenSCG-928-M06]|nr:hypothetical protein [Bacteroidales bacterium OttesenSCG-928-M06]
MKARYLIIGIVFVFLLTSSSTCCDQCDGGHKYITIINNTSEDIVCQRKWKGIITPEDTLFDCRVACFLIKSSNLEKNESANDCWEIDFRAIPYIQFFVLDAKKYFEYLDIPGNIPCDTVRKYMPTLQRYQLTLEELERMNWTVTYPPEK